MKKKFKFANQRLEITWNEDAASEPVEMMLYDVIGQDPWSGRGMTAADFKKTLDALPHDRDLHLRVNSKGGDVHEGMAMMACLNEWPKKITATIDGIAASTASWMILAADEIAAHKNSQLYIHDAISFGFGNADDFRKAAADLDKTSDQIASMYAEKTGKGVRTMRQKMKDETLLTGDEAEEMGLVDTLIEGRAVRNFTPNEINQMHEHLKSFYNSVAKAGAGQQQKNQTIMNREQIVALLKEHGVTVANEATDEQLQAAALKQLLATKKENADPKPAADLSKIQTALDELKKDNEKMAAALNEGKRLRISNEIDRLIANDQMPMALKEKALDRAIKDETYLDELRAMPSKPPGVAPVSAGVELVSEALNDIQKFVIENGPGLTSKFFGPKATHNVIRGETTRLISQGALSIANAIAKHKTKIVQAWNSNAIDSQLQRQVILQDMIEAYAIVIINLDVFSTVYNSIPLEGTDKVEVPYFPLQTTASTSFVAGTGYTTASDWTENSREINVGGDGASGTSGTSAAANTARDRKFQMISFYSYDLRRQPYLMLTKLFQQAANKLGVDIFTDIVSRVITSASFGASSLIASTSGFSADDVAGLRETATGLNWPQSARSLVVDHRLYTPLLKDASFKQYLAYGSTDPIRLGRIANAYGFENIIEVPNLTNYAKSGENMNGWINHKSAVLVATSPIMPTEEVRLRLARYDVVVEPKTGIAFEYRRWGDATLDKTNETVECSYGAGKGVDAALRRLTSA